MIGLNTQERLALLSELMRESLPLFFQFCDFRLFYINCSLQCIYNILFSINLLLPLRKRFVVCWHSSWIFRFLRLIVQNFLKLLFGILLLINQLFQLFFRSCNLLVQLFYTLRYRLNGIARPNITVCGHRKNSGAV